MGNTARTVPAAGGFLEFGAQNGRREPKSPVMNVNRRNERRPKGYRCRRLVVLGCMAILCLGWLATMAEAQTYQHSPLKLPPLQSPAPKVKGLRGRTPPVPSRAPSPRGQAPYRLPAMHTSESTSTYPAPMTVGSSGEIVEISGPIGQIDPQALPPRTLPPPKVVPGVVQLPPGHRPFGAPPRPDPATVAKFNKYVGRIADTEQNLTLEVTRTRLLRLKQPPLRVQLGNDGVAGYTIITPREILLQGKSVGSTDLRLWFGDADNIEKQTVLTYNLRVVPDPEERKRLQMIYNQLADEINTQFKDCNVCLTLVGDKVVVDGDAHSAVEARDILNIVRDNAPDPNDLRSQKPPTRTIPFDRTATQPQPGDPEQSDLVPPGLDRYDATGAPFIINRLRVPGPQQVMLRVVVAEVSRTAARSIGMNFTLLNSDGVAYVANSTGSIATGGLAPSFQGNGVGGGLGLFNFTTNSFGIPPIAGLPTGAGGFNNLPTALDNGRIRLAISALRDLNYAKSLVDTNLVTLNGQTANLQAGGEFPVPIVTGFTAAGLQGVSFVPFGVQLNFTPFLTDRDLVRLVINASVSSRDISAGNTTIGNTAVPSLSSRNFQTTVELREGQTLAIAGLSQNNSGADAKRVPLFGDLPILANLTGFSRITTGEQELVVLITPELVQPMEHHEIPPLPGSDLFEPDDIEFYLWGRIESHNPVDYRSPIRTDWHRIKQFYQMERAYVVGPTGHGTCDE
ncbi:MAG: type II and III secretion system protein family protein [Gemmataceae bacterium]